MMNSNMAPSTYKAGIVPAFQGHRQSTRKHSLAFSNSIFQLFILTAVTVGVLVLFGSAPVAAVVLADLLVAAYLTTIFRAQRFSFMFLLHPLLVLISSQFFAGSSYLDGGDAAAYGEIASEIIEVGPQSYIEGTYSQYHNVVATIKVASLGVVPSYYLPERLFGTPSASVYYIFQAFFHIYLCSLAASIILSWRSVDPKIIFAIILFAAISPTFFELGVAPTRHYVTFFGLLLLIMSHLALIQRFSIGRLIGWIVGIMVILISKAPYFLPYIVYILFLQLISSSESANRRSWYTVFLVIGSLIFATALYPYLFFIGMEYLPRINEGMSIVSSDIMSIPIIGWFVKYIYALLSPFPWSDAAYFISTNYSGNTFLFVMHAFSSLTGVYLLFVLLIKWKMIWHGERDIKLISLYGVVMSLSILAGAPGFHGYLSIFFPFLAPVLLYKRLRVPLLYPLAFIIAAEIFAGLIRQLNATNLFSRYYQVPGSLVCLADRLGGGGGG